VRRKVPSGRRRAIPASAVPAQSIPDGETSTESTWFEGSPAGVLKIFVIAPDWGSIVTMPPRVPIATRPRQATRDWISFEFT
jgi:hypothetical protein